MGTNRCGGSRVFELLKDKVVWHVLERDKKDLPKDNFPVIAEAWCFKGLARYGYKGWQPEESCGGSFLCEVKRWASLPEDVWKVYASGYFEPYDHRPTFRSEEEFNQFKEKCIHIPGKELPDDAVLVGDFSKDLPYSFYSASIYYKDNQYYLCDGSKEWALD